jgi:hypothetical protein
MSDDLEAHRRQDAHSTLIGLAACLALAEFSMPTLTLWPHEATFLP